MKKEMKIVLPFYKIAYAVSFVVILSVIRAVVFTYEIGLSIEPPFAILTAVFCADTYVQEITSNRSEVQRLYQIKKRIYSIIQRLMIQGTFLLLLAVLGYGLFFAFQKPITHPVTESEILQFITCFGAIVVTIFFWGILANTLSMLFRNMWMGIGSSLLIWVATNSTGGDKLFGAWNLFSYSFRDIENTADITWLYGKGLCICIGLILLLALPKIVRKRICSIMQRIMIQEFFLLLLAVLGYGLFFVFQKPVTHPATESEILQFIAYFLAIVVTIFFWGILVNTLSMLFRNMWMGIGSCLLIWVATNSTGGDKLFGAWNLFSYAFRDIENTADVTWLQGKALCIGIGLILLVVLPKIVRKRG